MSTKEDSLSPTNTTLHANSSLCNQQQPEVVFQPQTIFDESEDGIIFLHRWANAIHIDTKVMTLENEAAFFLEKCHKTSADLAELERHLRSRKYLRAAKVVNDEAQDKVIVTTWDNWSLLPTLSFGRKGGENTYSFGIKERNFLGLGIDAEIESYQNSQRSGYKLVSTIPLFQKQNTEVSLRFADNDDGTQRALFLQKHFAGFHVKSAYIVGFDSEKRNDTIFQNSKDQSVYTHEIEYKQASYAWLVDNSKASVLRYSVGVTQDEHIFSALSPEDANKLDTPPLTTVLPKDREFIYPWLAVEYIEKDFKELTNVHLISQIEDFNHGWQIESSLGLGNGNQDNAAWALWRMNIKKGYNLHEDGLLLLDLVMLGDIYDDKNNRLLAQINAEYFYPFSKSWGLYLNNVNTFSTNQYLDRPVTMGGNTGLRGFPLQYQHGDNSVILTSEIRYYPNINLFKLFDIAGVAFIDGGRAFGDSIVENAEKGWLSSVGVGIRAYSPHSGGSNNVIHIDFAFPQSNNEDIDNFEIRVQAKKSF
ncbi:hypothetical protein KO495_14805 [Colwellia sp. D2M02]|uniref:hypothetical protein n=1 Tax=Colwellia sp. D2M02 TaxID=2841562 RepID=UPI001C099746|nr:hypothetical protein [Colwellia sp. D2M02]MBU2894578.1 hypothetical protein [Colwellia sp. D2M02]